MTRLILDARVGDAAAANQLFEHLQATVRHIADGIMAREPDSHSLEPSALLNEALARIFKEQAIAEAPNRRYLYAAVIKAMRRVLIDHARTKNAAKRTPGGNKLPIDVVLGTVEGRCQKPYADLHEALNRLGEKSSELLEVVELRFLNGCTIAETAEIMELDARTVTRKWRLARTLLYKELHAAEAADWPGVSVGSDPSHKAANPKD